MKKLMSLKSFNSERIEANSCSLIIGGAKAVVKESIQRFDTQTMHCTDEDVVTNTFYDDGQFCRTVVHEICCQY